MQRFHECPPVGDPANLSFHQDRVWECLALAKLFVGMVPSSEQQWNSHKKSGKPNVGYRP